MGRYEDADRAIGGVLRALREDRGLSQWDVDAQTDGKIGHSSLGMYERGERTVMLPVFLRLAAFYGLDPGVLLMLFDTAVWAQREEAA